MHSFMMSTTDKKSSQKMLFQQNSCWILKITESNALEFVRVTISGHTFVEQTLFAITRVTFTF